MLNRMRLFSARCCVATKRNKHSSDLQKCPFAKSQRRSQTRQRQSAVVPGRHTPLQRAALRESGALRFTCRLVEMAEKS
jgi:hypothetical protein